MLVGAHRGELRKVSDLRGNTADGDVLTVSLDSATGAGVRYVRIETVDSPSWVAWREVRVFGR